MELRSDMYIFKVDAPNDGGVCFPYVALGYWLKENVLVMNVGVSVEELCMT